jgi:uridine kinase
MRSYSRDVQAFESLSTWHQSLPSPASAERRAVIGEVTAQVAGLGPGRLRVAIDGLTAAGKTSFGHELAAALRSLGRPAMRASMDDFKHPWRHVRELGYDRVTGEGYYRNAYDFASARNLLLGPAGPGGTGEVVLCAHDPLTGEDHRDKKISAPPGTVLIADSVFAFRPEYNDCWEYRIWLDVDADLALRRGISRDSALEGIEGATRLHRDRYHVAEAIYLAEVRPQAMADAIIDNRDFTRPRILSRRSP